jgi:hypothetical protein
LIRGWEAKYSPSWIKIVQQFIKMKRAIYANFWSGKINGKRWYGTDYNNQSTFKGRGT